MIFWLLLVPFLLPQPVSAQISERSVSVSASIDDTSVTIFGYTSPESKVELSNSRIYALTFSDSKGFFKFEKTLLPKNPSDLCLTTTDSDQRNSVPLCLPAPPPTNYHTDIGPIILPPTIAISNHRIDPGQTIITSGQSLPNSKLSIHFYKVNDSGKSFPKEVQAYSLPVFDTYTDSLGNFSLNLPTAYSSDYRLFATAEFQQNLSPKSNTLAYNMPSIFWLFWQHHRILILVLPAFILTFSVFIYLTIAYYSPRPHYLPAIRNFLPITLPKKI